MPYCTNCGSEIEDSWNICPNCGKALKEKQISQQQAIPQVQPQSTTPRLSSSYGNLYGLVALICGLVGLLGAILYFGIILGIIAMALGALGIGRDDNSGMAIIGLILGIIDIVVGILFIFLFFSSLFWFQFIPW